VDLAAETIEIRRRPSNDAWDRMNVVHRDASIAPRAFPEFAVRVDDILPSAEKAAET
jgi:hypothetical protein